jgi:uroporphyrinogen-III synthase
VGVSQKASLMSKKIYLFSTSSYPDTIHINSLNIKFFTPKIDFSKYDYLIITSKQVSKALQQYELKNYLEKPALCVSQQTAKSFETIGGKTLEVGRGYGDNLIESIKHYPKEKNWLYLRGKEIASDFVQDLQTSGYQIDEAIVYETYCSEDIQKVKTEDDSVLIFTSPSSIKCFLKNHQIKETHKIVVIGNTTAKFLPKNSNFVISSETTIASCMKIAKTL